MPEIQVTKYTHTFRFSRRARLRRWRRTFWHRVTTPRHQLALEAELKSAFDTAIDRRFLFGDPHEYGL